MKYREKKISTSGHHHPCSWRAPWLALVIAMSLTACLDSVPTTELTETSTIAARSYTGPVPSTADVQAFMTNVWDNLKATNRCGGCHAAGGQSPQFVRQDDINQAYSSAISVVDLTSPKDSTMVTKGRCIG